MFPDCQNLIGRETCLISPWLSSKADYDHNSSSLQQALCSFYSSGMWLRHKHFRRGEVGKKKNWQKTTKLILLNCAAPCLGYFTIHRPAEIILIFPFWQWKPRRKGRFLSSLSHSLLSWFLSQAIVDFPDPTQKLSSQICCQLHVI